LSIANSIWGQRDYTFLPEFLDVLAENYGAGLRVTDFAGAPESARDSINRWVSEQTQDKIKNLLPQGAITPLTRLVLANAIYFKAGWLYPFEPALTGDAAFNLLDGRQVSVPTMRFAQPAGLLHSSGDGYQAVALPYEGYRASMIVVVPDPGHFAEFEAAFSRDIVQQIADDLAPQQVLVALPKFRFEYEAGLAETLAAMGMSDAFTAGAADFSGIDGTHNLFISTVQHKAFVSVDEAGTEAAAATAVVVDTRSLPIVDVELTVDRPFLFLIRDDDSGSILFLGRVLDPAG
jgi:serpin B